ncbi:MAG: CPBP family intramembrane glutamic endopeptidase [Candidatus Dormibacteria bacterium]
MTASFVHVADLQDDPVLMASVDHALSALIQSLGARAAASGVDQTAPCAGGAVTVTPSGEIAPYITDFAAWVASAGELATLVGPRRGLVGTRWCSVDDVALSLASGGLTSADSDPARGHPDAVLNSRSDPRAAPPETFRAWAASEAFALLVVAAAMAGTLKGLRRAGAISDSALGVEGLLMYGALATGIGLVLYRHRLSLGGALGTFRTGWLLATPLLWFVCTFVVAVSFDLEGALGIGNRSVRCMPLLVSTNAAPVLVILEVCAAGPLLEELLFRRILFDVLSARTGTLIGAVASSAMWAALHTTGQVLLPFTALGMFLCWVRIRSRSIWPTVVVHAMLNIGSLVAVVASGCTS